VYVEVKLDASLNVPDEALQIALVADPPIKPFRLTVFPTQTEVLLPASTVGVSFTTIVIVVELAQSPNVGVNVYNVVAVLFTAGDQVPVIPFKDVVGNVIVPPEQIGGTWVKVGVTIGFTLIVKLAELAH
jgi:hypothetical protein